MAFILSPIEIDRKHLVLPSPVDLATTDVRACYDKFADTLYVHFYGNALPAISIALDTESRDFLYLRVEPKTERVTGLQIEGVSTYAAKRLGSIGPLLERKLTDDAERKEAILKLIAEVQRLMPAHQRLIPEERHTA